MGLFKIFFRQAAGSQITESGWQLIFNAINVRLLLINTLFKKLADERDSSSYKASIKMPFIFVFPPLPILLG